MNINKLFITAIAGSLIISACKKKSDDSSSTPTPTPTPTTSVICDGNGSSSYFPLALNNQWKYKDDQSSGITWTLNDTATTSGNLYFTIDDLNGDLIFTTTKLRADASGNIYLKDGTGEYLYVPANPVVGTTTPYLGATSFKVKSLTAAITTDSCSYTNLLEMDVITSGGTANRYYYYKKGIGMVAYRDTLVGIPRAVNLKQITLH